MELCANCSEYAKYAYSVAPTVNQFFCETHLPSFLRERAKLGLLPLPVPPIPEEAPAPKSRKKSEPIVEEPAVAEEPAVVEEPATTEEAPVTE
jgi:hypothetical protein